MKYPIACYLIKDVLLPNGQPKENELGVIEKEQVPAYITDKHLVFTPKSGFLAMYEITEINGETAWYDCSTFIYAMDDINTRFKKIKQ